jgi:uncharacterized Zn-finger protein
VRQRFGLAGGFDVRQQESVLRLRKRKSPQQRKSNDGSGLAECSFCGKPYLHLKNEIYGPGVYICDECVERCFDIIGVDIEARLEASTATAEGKRRLYGPVYGPDGERACPGCGQKYRIPSEHRTVQSGGHRKSAGQFVEVDENVVHQCPFY